MKTIKELMKWRFACKQFDTNKKIEQEVLEDLIDTIRLSPSSSGLQAWKFIVVINKKIRENLKVPAYNQAQVTEASALVFLCADTNLLGKNGLMEKHIDIFQPLRNKTDEEMEKYRAGTSKMIEKWNDAEKLNWLQKQVYLPVMTLILAAAEKGIDSCPMEGFDAKGIAEVLELPKNLVPTVMVSLGYRIAEPPKKARFDLDEVVEFRD